MSFELDLQRQRNNKNTLIGPRIINNPIANNIVQRYQSTHNCNHRNDDENYTSHTLPRRNPSLISNPLESYYVDNELASLHKNTIDLQQRRQSADLTTTSRTTRSNFVDGDNLTVAGEFS